MRIGADPLEFADDLGLRQQGAGEVVEGEGGVSLISDSP